MSTVDLVRIMQDFLQQLLEEKIWHLEGVLDLLCCHFSSSAVCFKKGDVLGKPFDIMAPCLQPLLFTVAER